MKAAPEPWPLQLVAPEDVQGVSVGRESLPASLAQIYEDHFDFVWTNARRLGVPEASADDVTQDVFLVVQRRIADFDGRAPMKAWIFGILVRVVRDHRRSFLRKGARNVSLEPESSDQRAIAHRANANDLVEHAERVRLFEQLLAELDEDKRTLLILSELEQWTLREIAELFGSNVSTIHARVRAAKRAFEQAHARVRASKEDLP